MVPLWGSSPCFLYGEHYRISYRKHYVIRKLDSTKFEGIIILLNHLALELWSRLSDVMRHFLSTTMDEIKTEPSSDGESSFGYSFCSQEFRRPIEFAEVKSEALEDDGEWELPFVKQESNNQTQAGKLAVRTEEKAVLAQNTVESFCCEICCQELSSDIDLVKHRSTHYPDKPFVCEICGKGFSLKRHLRCHKHIHTGEKPYKCKICGRGFSWSANLLAHGRTHSGEKPFNCEYCGRGFTESGHLVRHRRSHTGEKPFKCKICGKEFTWSANLVTHGRTHSGEKPFKCETCGKGFVQSAHLIGHMRTHTGEKPFKCEMCGTEFSQSSHLLDHVRRHTEKSLLIVNVAARNLPGVEVSLNI
ncbi:hypothetical protein ANN_20765 [Periplaneta americana]|uniref:C2H2-type domain-containing protein n=1 Tax=Periplaneta americana TaxID=6978 RepID=A0ABQ8SDJ8_PERAM|nr:hypothetical protein ANN_20765 [Periplaneta americana]